MEEVIIKQMMGLKEENAFREIRITKRLMQLEDSSKHFC